MTDQQFLDRLGEWLPRQRWFPFTATSDHVRLEVVGRVELDRDAEEEQAPAAPCDRTVYLIQATVGERSELLNIPVVRSTVPLEGLDRFAIGSYQAGGPARALPEQLVAGAEASASFLRRAIHQAGSFIERRRSTGSTSTRAPGEPPSTTGATGEAPNGPETEDPLELRDDPAGNVYLYDAVGELGFMDRVLRIMDNQQAVGGVLRHGMGLHGRFTGALNT